MAFQLLGGKGSGLGPGWFLAFTLGAVLVAAVAVWQIGLSTHPSPYQGGARGEDAAAGWAPQIELSPPRMLEGSVSQLRADPGSCDPGTLSLEMDGQPVALERQGGMVLASLSAPQGSHRLVLSGPGGGCRAEAELVVLKPECADGQSRPCAGEGCGGQQTCREGFWGPCAPPPPVCPPGKVASCAHDSCVVGLQRCNECGTGWGPCVPPEEFKP